MPDWEAMGMVGGNLGYTAKCPATTPATPSLGDHNDQAEEPRQAAVHHLPARQLQPGLHRRWGSMLAMLMELRQRNLITPADLDGIDMPWGDVHAVDAIMKKIIYREGHRRGSWPRAPTRLPNTSLS
jgi:hypothetical protein